MSLSIMDRLRAGSVLGAEGYVFELERRGYNRVGGGVAPPPPTPPDMRARIRRFVKPSD